MYTSWGLHSYTPKSCCYRVPESTAPAQPPTAPPSFYWVLSEQASLEPLPSSNGRRRMRCRGKACTSLPVGRGSTSGPAGTLQSSRECLDLNPNLVPVSLVQFPGVPRATRPRWPRLSARVGQGPSKVSCCFDMFPVSECVGFGCPVKWTFLFGEVLEFGRRLDGV